MSAPPLLSIRDLGVAFPGRGAVVEDVSLELHAGETLGLVGESGSGKSVTALATIGLSGGEVTGTVRLEGRDLLALPRRALRRVRGAEVAMIFQDPGSALDPLFTAGAQVAEVLRAHERLSRADARRRAVELLGEVGLPDPERLARARPHELSGGMQQRVLIAMATACRPRVLLADEPTTALDVTVQAQILDLLGRLQTENGMGLVLVSHDLGVVAARAARVAVMFAGRVVEEGATEELFARPRHPYTLELLRARPLARHAAAHGATPSSRFGRDADTGALAVHREPPGDPRRLEGCRFRARCPLAREACRVATPPLAEVAGAGAGHRAACHFPHEVQAP